MSSRGDESFSQDAFHRGAFHLIQPRKTGHRSGVDAMLLAASVPDGFDGLLADLGAGAGGAAMAVLSRCPDARADLFESEALMLECARRTLHLSENAEYEGRVRVFEADVAKAGDDRKMAGLHDNVYNHVIANPPFNEVADRQSDDSLRARAHVKSAQLLESWCRTAAAICRSNGSLSLILRPTSLREVLEAFDQRFGAVRLVPIHARKSEPAIRLMVTARKGSRAPLELHPPLVLHPAKPSTAFTEHADEIINGQRALF